jgi:hypothetical protein
MKKLFVQLRLDFFSGVRRVLVRHVCSSGWQARWPALSKIAFKNPPRSPFSKGGGEEHGADKLSSVCPWHRGVLCVFLGGTDKQK